MKEVRIGPDELFDPEVAAALQALAARDRVAVTLYYDRAGLCVEACQGDATVAPRHLRHRTANRLSTVRGLRVVPPHAALPRGRDRREVGELCLDALVVLDVDGAGLLLVPRVEDGAPTEEVDVLACGTRDELTARSLAGVLGPLEEALGPHEVRAREGPARPRALLVGVELTGGVYRELGGADLDELARLAVTAGLEPAGRVAQRRSAPAPGTFLGRGKVEEIRARVLDEGLDAVVVGCDLPYSTVHRLAEAVGVRVVDRSELILEIFAAHATSNEGRLQIRLARLEHELHRMLAEERDLDRQAGGIGVMGGAGESGAALTRRRIHRKKLALEEKLGALRRQREEGRRRRARGGVARVGLAGYTNAGKSTLLNALVGRREVVARDQLFTTLTTTTRRVELASGRPVLVSDTVGFVEKLPHHLVAAFETTLAESADTDLTVVLLEADAASAQRHREVVTRVLEGLGAEPCRCLPVLNKVDRLDPGERAALRALVPDGLEISARTGEGLDHLLEVVDALLGRDERELELLVPFERMDLVDALFCRGGVLRREWTATGLRVRARVAEEEVSEVREYMVG